MYKFGTAASMMASLLFSPVAQTGEFSPIFSDSTNWPSNVQLHDFNRDGNLDLLAFDFEIDSALRFNPSVMRQYTGNGDGTFTELDTKNMSLQGGRHRVADFNGDGYLDLIHDKIYPGSPDGRFLTGIEHNLPYCHLVGDFNSDGLLDFLCSAFGPTGIFGHYIFVNQGDFQFVRGTMLPLVETEDTDVDISLGIEQGDLNGDGQDDLVRLFVVAERPNYDRTIGHVISTNLAIESGYSENTAWATDELHDKDNPYVTNRVQDFKLADFNNDGRLDLIVLVSGVRATPDTTLVVYPGNGAGQFGDKITTTIGNTQSITDLELADMNFDGDIDVILSQVQYARANPQLNIAIYRGKGDGTFEAAHEIAPATRNVTDIAIGDIDGDAQLDIASVSGWDFGRITVHSRNATSAITSNQTGNACLYAGSDTDGDGWGYENDASCVITSQSLPGNGNTTPATTTPGAPVTNNAVCQLAGSDPDGDGWGWENDASCVVDNSPAATETTGSTTTATPVCARSSSDSDGDGWGWENGSSCLVASP